MTTLIPREKYTADELSRLYPEELALQQVQVVRIQTCSGVHLSYLLNSAPQTWCDYIICELPLPL
jgi:hypothetical protein